MAVRKRTAFLHRSSPRKRGPRGARTKELDSRLRGKEREELASRRPLSPHGLAVARLSGRRLLLFERHRMGGGGGRHQRRRNAQGLARHHAGRRLGSCDAVLFAHAHRAVTESDDKALRDVAELAAAFAPSKERHLETTAQGNAFVEATRAAWPCAALDKLKAVWDGPVAYPVAVAVAAGGHGIALAPSLAGLAAGGRRQSGLRRRAADPARPDGRSARAGRAGGGRRAHRARAPSSSSTTSVPPPSAPTSPAAGTRRNTHGCSAHNRSGFS